MFYYNKVKDVLLLEGELKKLKNNYLEALKKHEAATVVDLRKMIKALTGRINKLAVEK